MPVWLGQGIIRMVRLVRMVIRVVRIVTRTVRIVTRTVRIVTRMVKKALPESLFIHSFIKSIIMIVRIVKMTRILRIVNMLVRICIRIFRIETRMGKKTLPGWSESL